MLRNLLMVTAIAMPLASPLVLSQNLPDNSTFFTGNPPSLVDASTPTSLVNWPSPQYYFTFQIPADSPQSVGQVTFIPDASGDPIAFTLPKTTAFQGTQNQQGKAIAVTASQDKNGTISAVFSPPIAPGTTFTVSLQAVRNPSLSGVYQFRVQAFPAGTSPQGLDLGIGRFSFYSLR